MIYLSYKVKLILAMVLLILVVTASSLFFSTQSVERYYGEFLEKQFQQLSQSFVQDQQNRIARFSQSLAEATSNPRLTAAFEIGYTDGYDRFYYDLSTQLQPLLQRSEYAGSRDAPFFRFIDYEQQYLEPPESADSYLGIPAPVPEPELKSILSPFSTEVDEPVEAKKGYLRLNTTEGMKLFETWVFPTFDGSGLFMGDLVFIQRWNPQSLHQEGSAVRSGIYFNNQFFGPQEEELEAGKVEAFLAENMSLQSRKRASVDLSMDSEDYTIFVTRLPTHAAFGNPFQVTLFSLQEEKRILSRIQQTLLTVSGVVLVIGLLFSLFFGQRLSRRILDLVAGTRAIQEGDFETRIQVRGNDEVSRLGESFNQMSQDLALKEKYRSVLEKVTDASVANQLTSGSIELGGEERTVTILFCDIRGFTPLSRSISAPEIVELLNEHMTGLTEVVHKYHGVVDKFVGDEIMVLFGAPKSFGNDAELAVRCGMEMLGARKTMNTRKAKPIEVGIGIATGTVVAGCMGSEDRLNYTVIGNCVNLAARLCGIAPPGQLYLDGDTAAQVEDIELAETQPIQLKGFTARVPVFTPKLQHPTVASRK